MANNLRGGMGKYAPSGGATVPASELTSGIVQLASQAEVDAGTSSTKVLTPLTRANTPVGGNTF